MPNNINGGRNTLFCVSKYVIRSILVLLLIISVVYFMIKTNAETAIREASEAEIQDEMTFVKMTATLSKATDSDEKVNMDTLAQELDKYAGIGKTNVTRKTSKTLVVRFIETGNEYVIDDETALMMFTITYDANEGEGAPESQVKYYGEDIILHSTIPTRTNYEFLGWSTESTATTPMYKASDICSLNENVTLYAVWKLSIFKIIYNLEIGTLPAGSIMEYTNDMETFDLPIPTGTNYVFKGWYENSSLTGTPITQIPQGSIGEKVFYAKEHQHTGKSGQTSANGCYTTKTKNGGYCGKHYYETVQWYCGYCGTKVSSRNGGCGNNACSNTNGENPGKNWARTIDSGYKSCSKGSSGCSNWIWNYIYTLGCGWE